MKLQNVPLGSKFYYQGNKYTRILSFPFKAHEVNFILHKGGELQFLLPETEVNPVGVMFKSLKNGQLFKVNGNLCIKRSSDSYGEVYSVHGNIANDFEVEI